MELLEDYYPDELAAVFGEYAALHRPGEREAERVGAEEFLKGFA